MPKVYMKPIYRVTCWKCKTITDFVREDVKYNRYGSYDEYWHEYVECPICDAATVLVDHPDCRKTEAKYDTNPFIAVIYDVNNEINTKEPEGETND